MATAKYKVTSFGTARTFMKVGTCSGALMTVLDRAFGHPLETEERGVMPLAGGIAQQGYQCGMLWGAVLAAGAEAYRRFGAGPQAETAAVNAAQRLVEAFRDQNKYIDCMEVSGTDWKKKYALLKAFLKGGPITCMRKTGAYAKIAFAVIDSTLSEPSAEAPARSICALSCTAELAKKAGLSDMHTVMAAGLAAGIGFSGGACGALGAAIWINDMSRGTAGEDYHAINARAGELMDTFLKCSDYEFECSEIVGRKFEGIEDHAAHLQGGGCSKIIDVLAKAIETGPSEIRANTNSSEVERRYVVGA